MQIYELFGSLQTLTINVHPYCFHFEITAIKKCNLLYFDDSCFSVKPVNIEFLTCKMLSFVRKQLYALDNVSI